LSGVTRAGIADAEIVEIFAILVCEYRKRAQLHASSWRVTTRSREEKTMKDRWLGIVGAALLIGVALPRPFFAQTAQTAQTEQAPGPYARIAIMRALDGHSVDWEAGYIRHLEWHRQAKDTFGWYSYSVWASTEHQRWIIYATFGHTAAELSNPVSPAEDERDNLIQAYKPPLESSRPANQPLFAFVSLYLGDKKAFETPPTAAVPNASSRLGTMPLSFSFSLDRVAPGDYDCQVTILDPSTQKTSFWRAPVLIVP
jgi:hypothetical protein